MCDRGGTLMGQDGQQRFRTTGQPAYGSPSPLVGKDGQARNRVTGYPISQPYGAEQPAYIPDPNMGNPPPVTGADGMKRDRVTGAPYGQPFGGPPSYVPDPGMGNFAPVSVQPPVFNGQTKPFYAPADGQQSLDQYGRMVPTPQLTGSFTGEKYLPTRLNMLNQTPDYSERGTFGPKQYNTRPLQYDQKPAPPRDPWGWTGPLRRPLGEDPVAFNTAMAPYLVNNPFLRNYMRSNLSATSPHFNNR